MNTASQPSSRKINAPSYCLRVSVYDRTASMLISMLLLVGVLVVGLLIVYVTMQLIERNIAVPISLAEPGGRPADAAMGLARDIEPPGVEEAPELTEPDLPETLNAVADAAVFSQALLADESIESDAEAGRGAGRGDNRAAGSGGDGKAERVPRWERWRIRYVDGESLAAYATQLDHFGIELAVFGGGDNKVHYAKGFSDNTPTTRIGMPQDDQRIYFLWKDGPLLRSDKKLLGRAKISVGARSIAQFIPKEVEATLLQLELKSAGGRDVNEIRRTIFEVKKTRDGFTFEVVEQNFFIQ